MSRGVNKVILVGNVGKDPDMRFTPGQKAICNLSIATKTVWKDKGTGENKEHTEWHRVSMYNKLAEIAGEYIKKGSQVFIEGALKTREWTDKEGIKRYTTEVIASEMQMLGRKDSTNEHANDAMPKYEEQNQTSGLDDDDIPF